MKSTFGRMLLRDVLVDGEDVEIRGALELDRTPDGVLPRRLPPWTRPQIPDVFMNTVVTLTAGVRVASPPDSPVVELVTHPRTIHTVGDVPRPPTYQMVVDGVLQPDVTAVGGSWVHIDGARGPEGVAFEAGRPVTVRWDALGDAMKDIEIWLPTNSSVEVHALRVSDGA